MDPHSGQWFLGLDDGSHILRVLVRLTVAVILGAVIGYEREREAKAAGLRTHMLVTLGSCLFVLAPLEAGMPLPQLARVIQGLATGIGFLGAGTILKMPEERIVKGLTTGANIWVTAALGMAVGLGVVWPAILAVLLAIFILYVLRWLDPWLRGASKK